MNDAIADFAKMRHRDSFVVVKCKSCAAVYYQRR